MMELLPLTYKQDEEMSQQVQVHFPAANDAFVSSKFQTGDTSVFPRTTALVAKLQIDGSLVDGDRLV
jgi:hypothetical protein